MSRRTYSHSVAAVLLLAAAAAGGSDAVFGEGEGVSRSLFEATDFIADDWYHVRFVGETRYVAGTLDGEAVIEGAPARSSSLLMRPVTLDGERCPQLEWRWAVSHLQSDADIRRRSKEDVGAALFLLFGDPVSVLGLREVPMLRYVWTNARIAEESIVDSPFMPGMVRSIVVRSGAPAASELVTESRDVVADFRAAFGREPPEPVRAIGIFVDNDQTGQPGGAFFAWARASCPR